ncbi:amino acid transporter [Halarcobacter mediterraneus]|uniref:Amino acid transporter n=1 Tax=Halarcobacter mediterraneus TaxID=2023153 RepID=A0A4Q1AWJ2_9BACT|nr:APC family permease [Halarcobacter mediterraneus]RXK14088.1 amino acid transporter [Halarcobacter mediterraneus]
MSKVERSIGLFGAISIGVGGMVGGGIFAVLGEAVSLAHGATVLAFLFAGVVALLTSYSYAKLSVKFQSRGGTVSFIDNAFGHNFLSGSVNFMLWLSYLVTISLYAVAFSSYAQALFFDNSNNLLNHLFISLAIVLPLLINLVSASFVSRSETIIVITKVLLLILIIVVSFSFLDTKRLDPSKWEDGFSILVAGMIIFVAYEGFELISNSAEEIKSPNKNLPKAFYISVVLVIILYLLIAIITIGTVDEKTLMEAKDYALAIAAKPALGQIGFIIVSITALLATFSAINATIYGNGRLGYILAIKGELPKVFNKEKNSIPTLSIFITAFFSLFLANSIDINQIAIIGSASFLLIFFIVNLAALKLYKELEANKIIIILSCSISFMALITLLVHTFFTDKNAIIIFFVFIIISILFELFYGRIVRKQIFNRNYENSNKY